MRPPLNILLRSVRPAGIIDLQATHRFATSGVKSSSNTLKQSSRHFAQSSMAPTVFDTLFSLRPYHLLAYGTLLGMQIWQSQAMTRLPYLHLPPQHLQNLQKHVFPVYFTAQSVLAAITILTYPPGSLISLFKSRVMWTSFMPLGITLSMATLNLFVYSPKVIEAMAARAAQIARVADTVADGGNPGLHNSKRDFSRNHAMAIHLNAIAMVSTVWYGFVLASKLRF